MGLFEGGGTFRGWGLVGGNWVIVGFFFFYCYFFFTCIPLRGCWESLLVIFLSAMKTPKSDQSHLRKEMLIFFWGGSQCEDAIHHGREGVVMKAAIAVTAGVPGRKQRKMTAVAQLASPLCLQCGTQFHGMLPSFKVDLPSSANPLWKHLHRHFPRCVS